MTDQLQLVQVPPVAVLTDRQQHLTNAITNAGWDGLTSDELGAIDHARLGKHTRDQRCVYCAPDGRRLGQELRAKKVAKQSRRQREAGDPYTVWIAAGAKRPANSDADYPTGRERGTGLSYNEFPEGY